MKLQGQHEVRRSIARADGYAMAALLIGLSIMALAMTAVMPVWKQTSQREKEAELVFRGTQYVHAIQLFQRKSGPGTYPPSFDTLVEQKFLRKKYKDPITNGDFVPIPAAMVAAPQAGSGSGTPTGSVGGVAGGSVAGGPPAVQPFTLGGGGTTIPGGIAGVMSKSTDASIRIYNGQSHYNEWVFRFVPAAPAAGAAGPGGAGGTPQRGGPNQPQGPGGVGGQGRAARGTRGTPGAPTPPPGGRGFTTTGGAGRGFQTTPNGPAAPPAGPGGRPGPGD
jgi:type II secretory pathway pseudopilin PulG